MLNTIDLLTMTTKSNLIAFPSETSLFYRQICVMRTASQQRNKIKSTHSQTQWKKLSVCECMRCSFLLSFLFFLRSFYMSYLIWMFAGVFFGQAGPNKRKYIHMHTLKTKSYALHIHPTINTACLQAERKSEHFFHSVADSIVYAALSAKPAERCIHKANSNSEYQCVWLSVLVCMLNSSYTHIFSFAHAADHCNHRRVFNRNT